MDLIKQFVNDESGIETLEYAVIGAIVCAVAVLIYGTGWGASKHCPNSLLQVAPRMEAFPLKSIETR